MSQAKTSPKITRRQLVAGLGSGAAGACLIGPALAQQPVRGLSGEVTEATVRPRPIAIPEFLGEDQKLGLELANVVTK